MLEDCFSDSTEVVNLYATDTYREFVEMMYQWGQEGLLMPDAATTTENNLLSGNGFAQFENIKPGKEVEVEKGNNRDIVLVETLPANSYTEVVQANNFVIPYCAQYPEKAMELWEMMYTLEPVRQRRRGHQLGIQRRFQDLYHHSRRGGFQCHWLYLLRLGLAQPADYPCLGRR